jgi:TIM-barrel protein
LGGISIDKPTQVAARALADRGRNEFLPDDPETFIERQLTAVEGAPIGAAVNIRTTTVGPLRAVARQCAVHGAAIEVNAHCRQAELCAVDAGETLLRDTERICEFVSTTAAFTTTSVKVRAGVPGVNLPALAENLERAGADWLHIDAMDSEQVVREVRGACDLFIIANNGVRDRRTAVEYLKHGADAVSIGRPSDDPQVLSQVRRAVEHWFTKREVRT